MVNVVFGVLASVPCTCRRLPGNERARRDDRVVLPAVRAGVGVERVIGVHEWRVAEYRCPVSRWRRCGCRGPTVPVPPRSRHAATPVVRDDVRLPAPVPPMTAAADAAVDTDAVVAVAERVPAAFTPMRLPTTETPDTGPHERLERGRCPARCRRSRCPAVPRAADGEPRRIDHHTAARVRDGRQTGRVGPDVVAVHRDVGDRHRVAAGQEEPVEVGPEITLRAVASYLQRRCSAP